jgi:adenosylcobinamide amidohydrolase
MNTSTTHVSVIASAAQSSPGSSLMNNPLVVQGGISIAVIFAITLFVKALAELIKATRD